MPDPRTEFFQDYSQAAAAAANQLGIPASVVLGILGSESNFGSLRGQNGSVSLTGEVYAGQAGAHPETFKSSNGQSVTLAMFPDAQSAMNAFVHNLSTPLYANALQTYQQTQDPTAFIQALAKAGYVQADQASQWVPMIASLSNQAAAAIGGQPATGAVQAGTSNRAALTPPPTSQASAPANDDPMGPNGRTFSQITGTAYLSPEERAFYHSVQGSTPPGAVSAQNAQTQSPAPSTVQPGQAYRDDQDRYDYLSKLNYATLGQDAKDFLDNYKSFGGGRNSPRVGPAPETTATGSASGDATAAPDATASDGVARMSAPPQPSGTQYIQGIGGPVGNQTTANNAAAQIQNMANTAYGQAAAAANPNSPESIGASQTIGQDANSLASTGFNVEPNNIPSLETGGTAIVGEGRARMKLQPTVAAGSPWPPPGGTPPSTLRIPERVLGIGEKTGQVHFVMGDNPNGPETMTVTPPPGPIPVATAPPGNVTAMKRGGVARIGPDPIRRTRPVDWGMNSADDSLGTSSPYGTLLSNAAYDGTPNSGRDLRPSTPWRSEEPGIDGGTVYSYALGTPDGGVSVGDDGGYDYNHDSSGNWVGNPPPAPKPVPQTTTYTPPVYTPPAATGPDPAQAALDARKAAIAGQRATIGPSSAVIDAQGAVTNAQQGTIAPSQAQIGAQGNVINAQGAQTAGQRGFIGQEQTANAQAQAEEEAIQAAHANVADKTAAGQMQAVQNNQQFLYDLGGVTPTEVDVPAGTPLPANLRAKIKTQEQILTEKSAQAQKLRDFKLQGAKLAVDLLGTDVQSAQQAAARVGLTLDQANLLVKQAQVDEGKASQTSARANLNAEDLGYAASEAALPPKAGMVLYTDPVTGVSQYMTKKQADDLDYSYNKANSAARGTGSPDVPYSNQSPGYIRSLLAQGIITDDEARAALQARGVRPADVEVMIKDAHTKPSGGSSVALTAADLGLGP